MKSARRGFVLLSVLWFLAGVSSVALSAMLVARRTAAASANRIGRLRGEWRAEECVARARAVLAGVVGEERSKNGAERPSALALRDAVLASPSVAECPGVVDLEPQGAALDVNLASESLLRRVLLSYGIPRPAADSMTDALLDWRDADDTVRTFGAERAWYSDRGEPPPRNGPFADVAELRDVRGFAPWTGDGGVTELFTTDGGRVLLEVAPPVIVAALPGLSPLAAAVMEQHRRASNARLPELLSLSGIVPPDARADLERAFVELSEVATVVPEGWILRARSSGVPDDPFAARLIVDIELRLVHDGGRLAVTRRRISP